MIVTEQPERISSIDSDLPTRLDHELSAIAATTPLPDLVHHTRLDETWFSDRLAWLLDPRGSHGLGDRVLRAFLDHLAAPAGLDLTAAAVVRELHLGHHERGRSRPRHCDLAVLHLGGDRGFLVAIENKLFTTDHDDQLAAYRQAIEARFPDLPVARYAYLSLFGDPPAGSRGDQLAALDPRDPRAGWRPVSWVDHVLPALEHLGAEAALPAAAAELRDLLRWFAHLRDHWNDLGPLLDGLHQALTRTIADLLLAELQRLNAGAGGRWRVLQRGKTLTTLGFSRTPARTVAVRVLDNLAIAVMARVKSRGVVDQRVIPPLASADQLLACLDRTALQVYAMLFGDGAGRYCDARRRLRSDDAGLRDLYRPLLDLTCSQRHAVTLAAEVQKSLFAQYACKS